MTAKLRADRRPVTLGKCLYLVLIGIATAGCSGNSVANVDSTRAKQALRTTLEIWKKGSPIESLKDQSPSIVAQDMDWESGASLVKFDVFDEGVNGTASLRIPVELTIQDKAGIEVKKKVKYMVGTSPVITVFREIF